MSSGLRLLLRGILLEELRRIGGLEVVARVRGEERAERGSAQACGEHPRRKRGFDPAHDEAHVIGQPLLGVSPGMSGGMATPGAPASAVQSDCESLARSAALPMSGRAERAATSLSLLLVNAANLP